LFRKLTLGISAIFIYCTLAAQQTSPNTFLWRITGNDLSKPSYLYGTMHLQDRNLFTFGDSIYHAIEVSDGFAIELNPSEMMDTLFKMFAMPDNSPLIKDILSKNEYQKVAGKLSKRLKIPADKITTKKIEDERRNWLTKTRRKNDMPTFMDMYFYTIAQNQGKYVSGIEDLEDQIGLTEDFSGSAIESYLEEDDESRMKVLNDMKATYINRDLIKIGQLSFAESNASLIKRNIKMARRLDSLSAIRNTFFAVGAAHLPGDSGLISLLRKRGFTVDPVVSSNYVKPEDYHYAKKEIKWIDVADDHKISSVKMPGEPSVVNLAAVMPMRMYMDLSNTFCYGISVVPMSEEVNEDSIFFKITENFKADGSEILSTKKIEQLGAKGLEMTVKNDGYLRLQILLKSNKLFLLIFGVEDKEKLYAPEGVKFFNSLSINESNLTQQTVWETFSDKDNAFSILLPAKPISNFTKGTQETLFDAYTYSASDFSDGSYYMMIVKNSLPGYYIVNDSLIFENLKKNFTATGESKLIAESEFFMKDSHGYKLVLEKKDNDKSYILQVQAVFRGNRMYLPMTVTEKGKENSEGTQRFFSSFSFLPPAESQWKQRSSPENNFIAWAPKDFITKTIDSSTYETTRTKTFIATDKGNVIDFSIETQPISKYYWSNSDSAFFNKLANTFQGTDDSLVYYRQLNGDTAGAEALIKLHNSQIYKRLRTLVNGDTIYTLFSYFPKELKDNKNVDLFFTKFKFVNPQPNTIFTNKLDMLLPALHSTDSSIRSDALAVLDNIVFTKNDLPLLHAAWIKSYPADSLQYIPTNFRLGEKISALKDTLSLDFIDSNYSRFNTTHPELQFNMLEVLEDFKTERSYALLKKLLLLHPPTTGQVYTFSYGLQDSLLLTKTLFPEIGSLYSDSILGSALVKAALELIDSNMVAINEIIQYQDLIYSLSQKQLAAIKNNPEKYPDYNYAVIDILEKLNTPQAIALLKSFMEASNLQVKFDAATSLAKLDHEVPAGVLLSIAASNEFRTQLYSSLKTINKVSLFPKKFLTQQKFAEGYLYNYATDDEDSLYLEAKGVKTATINGKPQRYYFFKVSMVFENETFSYPGICGPFDINKKSEIINENAIDLDITYDEEYSAASAEKLFQKFTRPEPEKTAD
jgi:uncharacterized protein YbaP (TraB family)